VWREASAAAPELRRPQTATSKLLTVDQPPLGLPDPNGRYVILGLERHDDRIVVSQFNFGATNLTGAPVDHISGYVRSDVSGEKVPLTFNHKGTLYSGDRLGPIPVTAHITGAARFPSAVLLSDFLKRFATFSLIVEFDGKSDSRQFTRESYEAQIDDYQRSLRNSDAATARATPLRPLTAHAVDQKLKVIDSVLATISEAPTFLDRLTVLFRDPWQGTGRAAPDRHIFSDKVGQIREDLLSFSKRITAASEECAPIYPDVAALLSQPYLQSALERLAEYQNACREVEVLTSKGATISDVNFMYSPFVGNSEQAVRSVVNWRDEVRGKLGAIRQSISAA
jgi:hypothetical protein